MQISCLSRTTCVQQRRQTVQCRAAPSTAKSVPESSENQCISAVLACAVAVGLASPLSARAVDCSGVRPATAQYVVAANILDKLPDSPGKEGPKGEAQRAALGETVGSAFNPAQAVEDATRDNPNDSPDPADRSKQGQPFASRADRMERVAQLEDNVNSVQTELPKNSALGDYGQ